MKKTLAILLALVMMLATCTAAMAEGEKASIKITGANPGATYTLYKLLSLEKAENAAENAPSFYKVGDDWKSFFAEGKGKKFVENIAADGTLTIAEGVSEDDGPELRDAAIVYAANKNGTEVKAGNDGVVTFTDLGLGYYLVDSPVGVLDRLINVNATGEQEVAEKHSLPALDKKIVKTDGSLDTTNSVNVGDTVNFQISLTAQKGSKNYIIHDTLESGFDAPTGFAVKVNGADLPAANYEVVTKDLGDTCTFHIKFKDEYISSLQSATTIVITYSAKLNSKAQIAGDGNTNTVKLTYGETHTVDYTTTTYTGKIVIDKYDGGYPEIDGKVNMNNKLEGAKFKLYKLNGETKEYYSLNNGAVVWGATATELTTDNLGAATFSGIEDGNYYLEETEAPAGYNLLANPIAFTVTNGVVVDATNHTVHVANNTGSSLPSTGGMGTTIFYVVGGLMMAAAVVLLVTKKKTSGNR